MKKYNSYKDSGIEWIDEIPMDWHTSRIKHLCTEKESLFIDGDWIESNVIVEEGIRYITTGNVKPGYYSEQGSGFITEETFNNLNCTEVFEGDLLISRLNNPIGRACIVPNLGARIVTSVDNVIFRPDSIISKKFLLFLFSCKEYFEHTDLIARGATMQRISRGLLGNIKIPLPTLEDQTAIANYLDHKTAQIDALISKKEKLIELLNEERTALINHAVTKGLNPDAPMKDSGFEWIGEVPEHWEMSKLKHLSSIISKGTTPSTIGKDLIEEGVIKFIKAENIFENIIRDHPSFFIDEETNELLKRSNLCENDVLFVIAGATIGKVAILPKSFLPANTNQAVCFIRLKDTSRSMFVWLWLQSNYIREIIKLQSNQAAQPNISMEDIANFNIPTMDDNELQQIVSFIERHCSNLDSMSSRVSMQIDLLKEYRTALISEVVTGKVDVRDEILN